jgi:hypothetical protein
VEGDVRGILSWEEGRERGGEEEGEGEW